LIKIYKSRSVESRQLSHKFLSPDQNKKNIQTVEWKTGQQQKSVSVAAFEAE
jgi:hypothetical protein